MGYDAEVKFTGAGHLSRHAEHRVMQQGILGQSGVPYLCSDQKVQQARPLLFNKQGRPGMQSDPCLDA